MATELEKRYSFYNNYVLINDRQFLLSSKANESGGKLTSVHNINGIDIPFIQDLGDNEKKITFTIMVLGYEETTFSSPNIKEYNLLYSPKALSSSYYEQINFLENIISNKKLSNNVKVQLPDGQVFYCILTGYQTSFELRNRKDYKLEFIAKIDKFVDKTYKPLLNSYVSKLTSKWINSLNKHNNLWNKAKKSIQTLKNIKKQISSFVDTFQNEANNIITLLNKPNQWLNSTKRLLENITDVIKTPGNLFQEMKKVGTYFIAVKDLSDYTKYLLDDIKSTYKFKDKEIKSNQKPFEYSKNNEIINQNKFTEELINSMVNMSTFLNYTEVLEDVDFSNSEELLEAQNDFNNMYEDLLNNNYVDYDVKISLMQLKYQVDEFFNNTLQNVDNIIIIKIDKPSSLLNIVYNRYGNLNYYDEIILLNPNIVDINSVIGEIKVYAQ